MILILFLGPLLLAAFVFLVSGTFLGSPGVPLGLACSFLLAYLLGSMRQNQASNNVRFPVPFGANPVGGKLTPFHVIYLAAILAVLLVPSHPETVFNIWNEIGLLSYVRLIGSILLEGFLPGYAILQMMDTKAERRRPLFVNIVPAFILSLLLATVLEWILLRFKVEISWHSPISALFWLALLLVSVYVGWQRKARLTSEVKATHQFRTEGMILVNIILFYSVAGIFLNLLDRLLFFDAPVHISGALSIIRANRPVEEDHFLQRIVGEGLWYPSWFRLFLANFFLVSGFPPINGGHIIDLLILKPMPIIAFYEMARAFVGKRNVKVPIVATAIFFLFSGFVGLSSLKSGLGMLQGLARSAVLQQREIFFGFLDQVSSQNAYIAQYPIYTQFIHAVVPSPIGLTAMLFLLTLAKRKHFSAIWKGVLVFAASTVGFAFHEVEIILMVFVFYPLLMIFLRDSFEPIVFLSATVMSFLFILLMDWMAPESFFLSRGEFWLAMVTSILLLALAIGLKYVRKPSTRFDLHVSVRLLSLASAILILLYITSLLLWYVTPTKAQSWVFVPWYLYPIAYGVAGLLALVELVYLLRRSGPFYPETKVIIASILGLALIAKITPQFSLQIHEYRMLIYPFVGISFLAAFALVRMVSPSSLWYKTKASKIAGLSLVALVLLSGISGTVLAFSYWRLSGAHIPYEVLKAESGAINYLRSNRPLNREVATVNWLSRVAVIYSGAEHNWLTDFEPLFGERDPLSVLKFLDYRAVRNLYLTTRDTQDLSAWGYDKGFLVNHLIKYLPIAYQKSGVSIYDIPPLAPPSSSAQTALIIPSSPYLLDAVSLARLEYSPYLSMDSGQFKSSTIIVDDFDELQNPILDPARWGGKSGTSVDLKSDLATISFSTQLGRRTQLWARYRLSPLIRSSEIQLCINYKAKPPHGAEYYYFELQSANFKRLYASRLPAEDSRFQSKCYQLPFGINPNWITFGVETAGPMSARLDLQSITLTATYSPPWTSQFMDRDWNTYFPWVENGGRLIVAGDAQGVGASLLSLRIGGTVKVNGIQGKSPYIRHIPQMNITATRSENTKVNTIAYYTYNGERVAPLAFSRKVGRGEIVYLALSSYFRALDRAKESDRGRLLFLALGDLVDTLGLGLPKTSAQPYDEILAFASDVTLSDLKVVSSSPPVASYGNFQVARLEIPPVDGRPNRKGERAQTLTNVMIESVEVPHFSKSVLFFDKARVLPQGIGSYISIRPSEPFDWILSSEKEIRMTIRRDRKLLSLSPKGRIVLRGVVSKDGNLLVYRPEFSSRSGGWFAYATIFSDGPHGGLVWRSWMSLFGQVEFKVDYAGTYLHMHDTSISGKVKAGRINEWWTIENHAREVTFSQGTRRGSFGLKQFLNLLNGH